ncbi:MAG: hypothetical protein QNK20_16420 [Aureibaculum sp.]|nr:hypothetical protein [Aureibaculum sp.]
MKLKNVESKFGIFKYLLFLPFLMFTFCENLNEDLILSTNDILTKDSKVISLMISAVKSSSDIAFTKSGNNDQCTEFQYPITFILVEEIAKPIVISSDEQLNEFINSLTIRDNFIMYFPITLIDSEGEVTQLADLTALEGTLQMALDACEGNGDDDDDNNDNDGDDNNVNEGDNDVPWDFCHENNKKVYICHKGKTICVSINAIWGHTNQHVEDYLGQCE